ncbi:RWD protein [Rhizoctonia solani]|uniref:RBR-type E3 ubiquitin transferase n=1 Tax=Rhizoctonia solani TaxID=456999 RepID=A0A8H7H7Y5_9AGAM|nr:RWD protein [Rhizoctonia solani]
MSEFEQLQDEEIEALTAVYPDILTYSPTPAGKEIKLDISIELEHERKFELVSSVATDTSSPGAGPSHAPAAHSPDSTIETTLTHLPPLLITAVLPPSYPRTKPVIQNISARHAWLSPALVRKLAIRLGEMWTREEGEGGILWQWVEDVRSGAFLESTRDLAHPSPKILLSHLITHQATAKQARFSAQAYTCGICLSTQRGSKCIQLDCPNAHVFCLGCLKEFWGMCVSEGDVTKVACPGVECVKAKSDVGDVGEDVVRRVLTDEQVARWKWLRIKHAAEKDPHSVPCPVRMCQAPVPRPQAAVNDETGWSRLRTCDACGFAFCVACKRTWHGPVSRCAITQTREFVEAYVSLPEGDPRRRALEGQYGRKVLERMAQEYRDEKENEAWLKERTTACPRCETRVEKSEGEDWGRNCRRRTKITELNRMQSYDVCSVLGALLFSVRSETAGRVAVHAFLGAGELLRQAV